MLPSGCISDAAPDAGDGGCDACDCGSAEAGCGDVGGDATRDEEHDSPITLAPARAPPCPASSRQEAANAEAAAANCGKPGPLSDGVLRPALLLALVLRGRPSSKKGRDADETPPDRSL
jgi:hypothetical protein